jgi:mRNA interferase MazF
VVDSRRARRGEVWLVDLEPTVGHEIRKTRPCLVISPNSMNGSLKTCTVLPLTSGSRPAPFRIATEFQDKNGFLLPEQLRTADFRRLRVRLGKIDDATLSHTLSTLREMFEE